MRQTSKQSDMGNRHVGAKAARCTHQTSGVQEIKDEEGSGHLCI